MGNTGNFEPKSPTAHPDTTKAASAPDLSKDVLKEWRSHTKANRGKVAEKHIAPAPEQSSITPPVPSQADLVAATEEAEEDRAVDEIMREEADELLDGSDVRHHDSTGISQKSNTRKSHRKAFVFFILLFVGLAVAMTYPLSRYFLLNTAGVRSKASVVVLDNETRLPLKNVTVGIGKNKAKTDSSGKAVLKDLTLGRHEFSIERVAYKSISHEITIGWGSNPLGEFLLNATGVQYTINTRDYISGEKIDGIEARSGEAVATADNNGAIVLTLEDVPNTTIPLTVTAAGYRTETVAFKADQKNPVDVIMVPSAKTFFALKQQGRYDVMSMDIDGKNSDVLLPGSGSETPNTSIAPNMDGTFVAVVSHRDDLHSAQGQPVNTLSVIKSADKSVEAPVRAERIQLIDWIGSKIVLQESQTSGSADDPERYKLLVYDVESKKLTRLATSNQFKVVQCLKGQIYFAPESGQKNDNFFYKINPDGSGRQIVLGQEVWSAVRTGYDSLRLQTPSGWFAITAGGQPAQSTEPTDLTSRQYIDGPNHQSLWVDTSGGRSALLNHDNLSGKDTIVASIGGISNPVRWLGTKAAVVRVAHGNEAADYAVSLVNGSVKKINTVANTYGLSR